MGASWLPLHLGWASHGAGKSQHLVESGRQRDGLTAPKGPSGPAASATGIWRGELKEGMCLRAFCSLVSQAIWLL